MASDVWVHPAVEVRASPIAGHGLFATERILAGTVLIRFGGRLVTTVELHRLFASAALTDDYVDTIAVGLDEHLVLPTGTIAHFGNHSCEPTTWLAGPLELVARRDLEPGDEVTSDYGVTSDDESFRMDCACGAPTCRRTVTGTDWMRADLQVLHEGRWPPGLQRRIEAHHASE